MPQVRWKDLSDIKHNILGSLQKVSLIEHKANELKEAAQRLRREIVLEVDKYNAIINRSPDNEKDNKPFDVERRKNKE